MSLLWLPIDLPKFPTENLDLIPDTHWAYWKFKKLTNSTERLYQKTDIIDDIKIKYPEIVSWFRLFPYKNIRNIKFNLQLSEVGAHIDFTDPSADPELHNNNAVNEPCGYRVLLRGKRSNALYVMNDDKKIYVELPEETDVYILGHTNVLHGVEYDPGRLTLFTHFEIDESLHQLLVEKSLEKYSRYAIYS